MDRSTSVSEHLVENYSRQVREIAERLRRLANDIEQGSELRPNLRDGKPDAAGGAQVILHKLRWGYANLPMDLLLSTATEHDRHVRSAEGKSD